MGASIDQGPYSGRVRYGQDRQVKPCKQEQFREAAQLTLGESNEGYC